MLLPDGYKRRTSSTVPFGYQLSESIEGYLKPIPEQLEVLEEIAESVHIGEISLGIGMSRPGLKKYVDKKYGRR